MKKKRSDRMQVVFDLAERQETKAMDALTAARRFLDDQEAQLRNLEAYHQQYSDNMRRSMAQSMAVSVLQSYQNILSQVDKAIEHQTRAVELAQQQFERVKQEWFACREKRRGVGDLIEKYRQEELLAREKKESKLLEDDFVGRRYRP